MRWPSTHVRFDSCGISRNIHTNSLEFPPTGMSIEIFCCCLWITYSPHTHDLMTFDSWIVKYRRRGHIVCCVEHFASLYSCECVRARARWFHKRVSISRNSILRIIPATNELYTQINGIRVIATKKRNDDGCDGCDDGDDRKMKEPNKNEREKKKH